MTVFERLQLRAGERWLPLDKLLATGQLRPAAELLKSAPACRCERPIVLADHAGASCALCGRRPR